ncbi:hypothetical protein [Jidongwangia harbinensis]|uniref:hypothetical protein n=1 Tax=Jidongwangia harbinensis TaxID=2878561 RepID=UPI001CD94266|nr:hypothetical protein [Jidongwangia harbinensis]MCA2214608.1 hypothetical protein [Jidongwangia harbinensis]
MTVAVFAYGTAVHVGQLLIGGLDPYPSMPAWLAGYFVALTIADPATALLLAFRRIEGLVLACLVLATDALANAYANYAVDQAGGVTPGRVGQAVITLLTAALLMRAPAIAPWLRRRPSPSASRSQSPRPPEGW